MTTKYLAAVFFIPKESKNASESMESLLKKAGATKIAPPRKDDWAWYCHWAGMICDALIYNELKSHQLLIIYFSQNQFLDGIPDEDSDLPLEKDGNLHLALAFRDACEALEPEVAYIATHTYYAELEWILKNVQRIESYSAIEIAEEAGLLYMRGIIADCLVAPPPEDTPDTIPVKEGVLIFGGQGSDRALVAKNIREADRPTDHL